MLVSCSCWALPLSKSARVLRRLSGRRREPRCSALKGGFLCRVEAMVKADCTDLRLRLSVRFKRKSKRPQRLTCEGHKVNWKCNWKRGGSAEHGTSRV